MVTDKEFHLMEINRLYAESAELATVADRLGKKYTEAYCSFKVGDKIVVRLTYSGNVNCVVRLIHFHKHSTIEGMASLTCEVWNNNFTEKMKRRNMIIVRDKSQIVRKVN